MAKSKWVLDHSHSDIQFKIKHLMISTVTGQFNTFDGFVETEGDDFSTAHAEISINVDSINTNNAQRDGHLKANDFFDITNHPQITFSSTKLTRIDDEKYKVHGTLTLRGVSKDIVFDAELGGIVKQDPWGNTRAGFLITGKINRKDFGVSFGLITDTGGIGLGEDVQFIINAQFVIQVEVAVAVKA